MTTVQNLDIVKKLISTYTLAIQDVNKTGDKKLIREILKAHHVESGVCHVAANVFKIDISLEDWVIKYIRYRSSYWYASPTLMNSKEGVLRALMYRFDILMKVKRKLEKEAKEEEKIQKIIDSMQRVSIEIRDNGLTIIINDGNNKR